MVSEMKELAKKIVLATTAEELLDIILALPNSSAEGIDQLSTVAAVKFLHLKIEDLQRRVELLERK